MEDHNEDSPGEEEHCDHLEDHIGDQPGKEEHHDQLEDHRDQPGEKGAP